MALGKIINFGDIIKYNGFEAVYLFGSDNNVYLASILGQMDSEILKSRREQTEKKAKQGDSAAHYRLLNNANFRFIVLTTEEFKERIAMYDPLLNDPDLISNVIVGSVNENDLKELIKEIDGDGYPGELRKFVRSL
jgi:hypothetical protein